MRLTILICLLLLSTLAFAQGLTMKAHLDQKNALLHIEIRNEGKEPLAIIPAFQNYFISQHPNAIRGIFLYQGAGVHLALTDSIGRQVFSEANGRGDNAGPGSIAERNSMWYRNLRFFPANLIRKRREGMENIRFNIRSAICLQPGHIIQGQAKLHKALFKQSLMNVQTSDSTFSAFQSHWVNLVVTYRNSLTRDKVKEMMVPACDSLFTGWVTTSDTIRFSLR